MKPYYGWLAIGLGVGMILLAAGIGLAQSNLLPSTGTKAPESPVTPANGLQRAIQAVCAVTAYDAQGQPFSSGSAVIVASNMAVTCHHVVKGAAIIILRTYDGKKLKVIAFSPWFHREFPDLSVLKIDGPQIPPPIYIVPDGNVTNRTDKYITYHIGDHVYALGNPQGLEGTVSDGIISGMRCLLPYGDIIQTTAPISQGSSGGALVNTDGIFIGLVVWQMKEGQNLNFALSMLDNACLAVAFTQKADCYPVNKDSMGWWSLPVPIRDP